MNIRAAVLLILILAGMAYTQPVNGKILVTENNMTWVKVWGSHYQRGYAQGYLLAARINDIYKNYIAVRFGLALPLAKQLISDTSTFKIDSVFIAEAGGVADGMSAAGITGYTATDFLVANSLLDLAAMMGYKYKINFNLGCSSLMSWGDATIGTPLNGKSQICRHLDWETTAALVNNQIAVVHIPAETGEQPWIMIGFAGQISVLSGTNKAGLSTFQHVLSGMTGKPVTGKKFEPIWFSLRKGLEQKDFNNDGKCNTEDIRAVLSANVNGYAASCIIPALAASTNGSDSLIALVSEVTFAAPTHTFRTNSYEDNIPGDNLYAANSPIKRNDARAYCARYNATKNGVGSGLAMDSLKNWVILRDSSRVIGNNVQFIQIIPELKVLKISTYKNSSPAYFQDPAYYSLDTLFSLPTGICCETSRLLPGSFCLAQNYPNPFNPSTKIDYSIGELNSSGQNSTATPVTLKVYNVLGKEVVTLFDGLKGAGKYSAYWNAGSYSSGIYYIELKAGEYRSVRKMVFLK